jgi:uncharacterized protein
VQGGAAAAHPKGPGALRVWHSAQAVAATICNVIGFDDAPFAHDHRGDVRIFGVVCARTRLDGVVSGLVRRDGVNSTERMIELVEHSQFRGHVRGVLLQGIAVAGFNVVDVHELAARLGVPLVVVSRRKPRLAKVRAALDHTPGAARKWRLIERAGPMEPLGKLWVQRIGIERDAAARLLEATTLHGNVPEALRLAHLIAGGVTTGKSRGRA